MKKIQATTISDVAPTINETVANGYALGQWWQVNGTGEKYYHKTDGVWVLLITQGFGETTYLNSISATTISATTIYSGSTNLLDVFIINQDVIDGGIF